MVRDKEAEAQYDEVLLAVERRKSHFPDAEHRDWRSYINHPRNQVGIDGDPGPLFPHIVVLDKRGVKVAARGNVVPRETVRGVVQVERQVGPAQANRWKEYGDLAGYFHVFVPAAMCEAAKKRAVEVGANIFSLWRWWVENGSVRLDKCDPWP